MKGLESCASGFLLLEALEELAPRSMSGAPPVTLRFLRSTALEVDEFLCKGIGSIGKVYLLSWEGSLRDPRLAEEAARARCDLLSSCEGFVFVLCEARLGAASP